MAAEPRSKRQRLAVNSLFSVVAWIFPILVGFVSTPVLVHNLGSEQYGLFAVVLGFISYSFAFGVGKVAGKYVPEYQNAGEYEKVTEVISATFWVSLAIGVVGGLSLAAAAGFIVRDALLIEPGTQSIAITALYIAAAIGVISMLSQVFQFVLQGLHRFDNYAALINLNGLLLGAGNIALALNGFGVRELLLWNLVVVGAIGILFYVRAKHLLPSMRLFRMLPREMLVTVAKYAGSIVLYQVFANALLIFERAWVTRKAGSAGLTYYFVPMILAIYMHGFVASLVQSLFPVVNEMLADRAQVAELYRRANKIVMFIVVFILTGFVACGSLFLRLWISEDLAAHSYPLLIAHGVTFSVIAMVIMAFQLADAYEFPALNAILTGSWMLLGIPLMIVAADIWFSPGVAWARFAATLTTFPMMAYAEHRFIGKIQWRFWAAIGSRLALAAIATGTVEWLVIRSMDESFIALMVAGLAGSIVFVAVLGVTGYLTAEEREFLSKRFLRRSEA
jgi:O-antigen/teichoic acid export membrane protein